MTNLRFVNEDCPAACLRTDPQFSMVVPLRSQARLWHSLLHWAYFGLFRAQRAAFVRPAYGSPVFRRCAPPSPSAARCSGAADAFWACPRASSRFAAFDCALRVLAPPAASRPPMAATGTGMHFYPQFAIVDPRRTQSVLVALVAHWAYFGLFPPQAAASVRILNSQWSSCCA